MKNIAIYGAGGLGRETALLIRQINANSKEWNLVGFYDDGMNKGEIVDRWLILGGITALNKIQEPLCVVISVADSKTRAAIVKKITNHKVDFPAIIHPSCQTGDELNHFGRGCVLTAGTILTTGIELGEFVFINLLTTLGHDAVCGDFTTIMPGCSISGNVKIGEGTMIGTGARILQNLSIGKNCKVGAGAVVTQNFPENKTIIGVPAREK